MATTPITRNNTIDEWRINTNLSAEKLNNIETGDYTKSNGTLALTEKSSLVITSEGTALQVSNNALFQSGVQIGKDVSIGVESSATGNVTIGGVIVVRGPGVALQVANNALVNSSLQVTKSIVTGNVNSNNDVSIGNDLIVGNVVTISGTSQVLNVYSGSAFINTATLLDATVTNTSISNAVIGAADITDVDIITADILGASIDDATIDIARIDVATCNISNSIFSNVQTLVVNQANVRSGLSVSGDQYISGKLNVTGNATTGNVVTSGLLHAGSIRTTGRSDISGALTAGATTLNSLTVEGSMSVGGNFTLTGETIIDSDSIVLNSTATAPANPGYFAINRGESINPANANAHIRWNETNKVWDIRDVNNKTSYSRIVTANNISDSLLSISSDTISSSKAANTLNDKITNANTSLKAYVDGTVTTNYTNAVNNANTSLKAYSDGTFFTKSGGTISGNTVILGDFRITGARAHINAESVLISDNVITLNSDLFGQTASKNAGIEVNRGTESNVFLLWNESINKWTYTNDGVNYSNVASESSVTNANTSLKAYVDGTVTTNYTNAVNNANTSLKAYVDGNYFLKSGGTISGNLGISGNLNVQGTVTYINTTQLEVGDNIIVLNADIDDFTPGTDAGIEVNRGIESNTRILWNETSTKWTYTNDGTNYNTIASGEELVITRNHANSAYAAANNVAPQIQPAFDKANTTNLHAVSAYDKANTANLHAVSAYDKANTAPTLKANNTIVEYEQFINTNYSITAGRNALSAGPITINNGFTVTISDSSNWTIV